MALKPRKNGTSESHSKLIQGDPASRKRVGVYSRKRVVLQKVASVAQVPPDVRSAIPIPRGAYAKITLASKNMHMTGKEKTVFAKPFLNARAFGRGSSRVETDATDEGPFSSATVGFGVVTVVSPAQYSLPNLKCSSQSCLCQAYHLEQLRASQTSVQ